MNQDIQLEVREFAISLLQNLQIEPGLLEMYQTFISGKSALGIDGEPNHLYRLEFPLDSQNVKTLTITDDITDSEQNISFDVSSVIAGNIAYFLVNVDSVHTHVTDKENMVQDYFFNYVSDDSLPCDGYVHDINDCKKYFDAIIRACGLETHILEE